MTANALSKTLLVIGGSSDIGRAIASRYAVAGWQVVLAVRDVAAGTRNASDIAARSGRAVPVHRLDILETDQFAAMLDGLPVLPDTVVCVVGDMGDQARSEADPLAAQRVLRANFEGPALFLGMIAERFAARGTGAIVGISSVAGDRGRASNYIYGAAKAGFTAFLSGLRNRLAGRGIRVVTVKPGFVRTRMTEGMALPGPLTADPSEVGRAVFRAAEQGRGEVIYVRGVWRPLMMVIRAVPERIFKRMQL
ncbi:short-chain dehydrogenase [Tistrella bauzanensis]|uniref:Short-chain dehydrogenase n=1 Tax=Tistrella bauzanensis TaxID=657419 RepID=A0ABQ1I9I7_9PROT|nr:SDR family oxidoreductase [Tistrella bauzanensis]GGB30114.1 short-chain dehydrogenase [Tistrella bauzanensis]